MDLLRLFPQQELGQKLLLEHEYEALSQGAMDDMAKLNEPTRQGAMSRKWPIDGPDRPDRAPATAE